MLVPVDLQLKFKIKKNKWISRNWEITTVKLPDDDDRELETGDGSGRHEDDDDRGVGGVGFSANVRVIFNYW